MSELQARNIAVAGVLSLWALLTIFSMSHGLTGFSRTDLSKGREGVEVRAEVSSGVGFEGEVAIRGESVEDIFALMGWDTVLAFDGIAKELPGNIGDVEPVSRRKRQFVGILLPVIIRSLEKVMRTRSFLLGVEGEVLSRSEEQRILGLCKTYRVSLSSCDVEALLLRVDVLPIAIILAQAAIESGWGTSRFAQEGNALFGQWTTFDREGIVPEKREEGKTHKIRSYTSIGSSVDSYLRNMNSHRAYRGLWEERKRLRTRFSKYSGYLGESSVVWHLVPYLESYSEKGADYIFLVKDVIKFNGLEKLDTLASGLIRPVS